MVQVAKQPPNFTLPSTVDPLALSDFWPDLKVVLAVSAESMEAARLYVVVGEDGRSNTLVSAGSIGQFMEIIQGLDAV